MEASIKRKPMKGLYELLDLFELPPPCAIEDDDDDDDDSGFDSDIDDNFYDIFSDSNNSDDDDSDYYVYKVHEDELDQVPLSSSWCYVKVNKKVYAPTVENVNHDDDHKDDDDDESSLGTLISLPFLFPEFNLKSISYLLLVITRLLLFYVQVKHYLQKSM
jgi:hypothetical protein